MKEEKPIASEWRLFVPVIAAIVFIPVLSIIIMNMFFAGSQGSTVLSEKCSLNSEDNIRVSTDKKQYRAGEEISLSLDNGSQYSVYFEPCKFFGVFEKKDGDNWVLEEDQQADSNYYKDNFEKKEGNALCNVPLPKSGEGTYRLVAPVFYGCTEPSRYACKKSELLYSNTFEISSDKAN